MFRFTILFVVVIFFVGVLCIPQTYAGSLDESWYRMRSQANMKIGNYTAAIEAYEKYLELKPHDREAMKGIALAYEKQGKTDQAISRYDNYLETYKDDPETAFKQANFLSWSRYAYRKADAIKYFKMGLDKSSDPVQRFKYARLLAQGKYDLDRAVEQYSLLIKDDPENNTLRSEYRGVLLWDNRFLEKAITEFEIHLKKNPNDFRARLQYAGLLVKTNSHKKEGQAIYIELMKKYPDDFNIKSDYAKYLAQSPANFDEARRQYSDLVQKQPDNQILLEYAQLLESRPDARPEATKVYTKILARNSRDVNALMKRAAIYMDGKSTANLALEDYRQVIKQEPRNAAAHQGAAKALAWLDKPDDALYHAKLAREYGNNTEASSLFFKLSKGHEPGIAAIVELPSRRGSHYKMSGTRMGARINKDLSSSFSLTGELGVEQYKSGTDDASSGWWLLGGEYLINAKQRLNFSYENHSVKRTGDPTAFEISFNDEAFSEPWSMNAGYAQRLIDDSFLSLIGDSSNNIGGAVSKELFVKLDRKSDAYFTSYKVAIGAVDSASETENTFANLSASYRYPVNLTNYFITDLGMEFNAMSYAEDHSGFGISASEPYSGGYFSPQGYVAALFYAEFNNEFDSGSELMIRLGPKFQYVSDASVSGETSTGIATTMAYRMKKSDTVFITVKGEYESIGNIYDRILLSAWIHFIF